MTNTQIIVAGDSNALGYLNTGPAPYVHTAQVQIWALQPDGSHAWNYMRPGINTGTPNNPDAWGPEVEFANKWLETAQPGDYLWIVKNEQTVKGGTTLEVDWDPNTGVWFDKTAATAYEAMHNLDGSVFAFDHYDAALVVLGENDAVNPAYAAAYQTNLAEFNDAVRLEWDVTTILQSRITEGAGAPADNLAVRVAQWAEDQADDDLITFKTIGYEMQPDNIHYDATGFVQLGQGFWNSWLLA